jgi:hypothetical protein
MTQDGERGLTDRMQWDPEDLEWKLPVRLAPFLEWLDEARLAVGTEDSLAMFMKSDVAKKMPATLKNDLRMAGWFKEAEYAESVGFR